MSEQRGDGVNTEDSVTVRLTLGIYVDQFEFNLTEVCLCSICAPTFYSVRACLCAPTPRGISLRLLHVTMFSNSTWNLPERLLHVSMCSNFTWDLPESVPTPRGITLSEPACVRVPVRARGFVCVRACVRLFFSFCINAETDGDGSQTCCTAEHSCFDPTIVSVLP